jgi:hypothetical protein
MSRLSLASAAVIAICATPVSLALDDADVRELERACEERRKQALAPLRERKTQVCIDQQMRSPDSCHRYYATYGNRMRTSSGTISAGYYYDLPECQQWLQAREELSAQRSRP